MSAINGSSNPYLAQLFSQLGMPPQLLMAQAGQLPPVALQGLHNAYTAALGPAALFSQMGGVPPFMSMPNPAMMMPITAPISGSGFGGRETIDLAKFAGGNAGEGWWARTFNPERRQAMATARALENNPMARAAFEAAVGGRVVDIDSRLGKVTIERSGQPLAMPGMNFGANPAALQAFGAVNGMQDSLMSRMAQWGLGGALAGGAAGAMMGNPFLGLALGGLGGLATGALAPSGAFGGQYGALGQAPFPMASPFGPGLLDGAGFGSLNPLSMPGRIGNTNPAYEAAHTAQVSSVMNDPSLSVEDKIMLCLMLICKKMDNDIENQMQYINAIQNQQANRQKKGQALGAIGTIAGGVLGGPVGAGVGGALGGKAGGGGNSAPSVDIETKKLERMITKRAQMFEMLSNIMKKYDETAKNTIQQIR